MISTTKTDTSLFLILGFLALTLAVGYYFSKKTRTFREYAVGNKQFTTAALVATVLATNYGGGGLLRGVEQVHKLGLYWIVVVLANSILSFWLISRLATRMGPFLQHLSMAETIGTVYGTGPRVATALSGIGVAIGALAIQINAITLGMRACLGGMDPTWLTLLATCILIFYSTFGGIRGVTYTDCLQFVVFFFIIPCLGYCVFFGTNKSMGEVFAFVCSQTKFQLQSIGPFSATNQFASMLLLLCAYTVARIEPALMQRMYMASDAVQAQRAFKYANFFAVWINLAILLIGLFVFASAPDVTVPQVWPHVMDHLPDVFKGLLAVSLLAMTMSTADSCLNNCTVLISHDILGSLPSKRMTPYVRCIGFARLVSLSVGICAMLLAFFQKDLLELLKLTFAFSVPIVTAPFLLALYGFRSGSRTALIGMGTGACSILVWNAWIKPRTDVDGEFVCMLLNGLAMLIAHHRMEQPEGSGWVEMDETYWRIRHAAERRFARFGDRVEYYFGLCNPKVLAKTVPKQRELVGMALYCLATTYASAVVHREQLVLMLPGYLRQMAVAVVFGFLSFLREGQRYNQLPKYASWKGFGWIVGLLYVLLLDTGWHWKCTDQPGFTVLLTFAHVSVFFLMVPFYTACYLTVVVAGSTLSYLMLLDQARYCFGAPVWHAIGSGVVPLTVVVWCKKQLRIHQDREARWIKRESDRLAREELRYRHKQEVALRTMGKTDPGEIQQVMTARMNVLFKQYAQKESSHSRRTHWVNAFLQDISAYIQQRSRLDHLVRIHPEKMELYHDVVSPVEEALEDLDYMPSLSWQRPVVLPPENHKHLPEHELPRVQAPQFMVADPALLQELLMEAVRFATDYEHEIHPEKQVIRVEFYAAKMWQHKSALSNKKRRSVKLRGPLHDADAPMYNAVVLWVGNETLQPKRPHVASLYFATDSVQPTDELHKGSAAEVRMRSIVDAHHGFLWCHPPAEDQSALDAKNSGPTGLKYVPVENSVLIVLPLDVEELADQYGDPYTYLCVPTKAQRQEMAAAKQAFLDYISTDRRFNFDEVERAIELVEQLYSGKVHASGVLLFVRTLEIATLVIREWQEKPELFAAALGPKEVLSTHVVVFLLLYGAHKQSFATLDYFRTYCPREVYRKFDAAATIESKVLSPNFSKQDKGLFEKYRRENRLIALYVKLTEWYYDLLHASGYTNQALLKKQIDRAREFKIDLALRYFRGTTVANHLQDKAIAAVMYACDKPVGDPPAADRKPLGQGSTPPPPLPAATE